MFDLREMLVGRTDMAGKIISTANGAVRLATAHGVVEVVLDGGSKVGDRVSVRDGRVVRVQKAVDLPVFWV